MNAASSIKYPVTFAGQHTREIFLEGEAYFEVAHDARHPFIVRADKQITRVLGTRFDIEAYPGSGVIKTTLLEGSLKVKSLMGTDSCLLVPGKQAILTHQLQVKTVDVENVIDWKDGYFIFDNESLKDILTRLERWYSIQIVYQNNVQNIKLDGIISKNTPLSEVLEMLSGTGKVHFEIKNKTVVVSR